MIDDELMKKFNSIEDLPISEEMLGAYMEGKLDIYDMDNINMLVHNNQILQSIVEDTANIAFEIPSNFDSIHQYDAVNDDYEDISFNISDGLVDYDEPFDHFMDVDIEQPCHDHDIDNFLDDSSFELPEIPFFNHTDR